MRHIEKFTTLMEAKMLLNEHKGGWDRLKAQEIIKLMKGEIKELEQAIEQEDYKGAILECADVGNYASILADKLINRRLV